MGLPIWTRIIIWQAIAVVEALLAGNTHLSAEQKTKLEALLAAANDAISVF